MIRRALLAAAVFGFLGILLVPVVSLAADSYVHGYFRSNGTYVQPHYRSAPDGNVWNNYSTYPNVNPYTGEQGTKYRYTQPDSSPGLGGSYRGGFGSSSPSQNCYRFGNRVAC